jgi:prepilin-type N-terminal cleavage/methylation domain-containing protein
MRLRRATGKGAFTLIELLIVVLVIAVLAAIAVPNFLEAQARSKVSRAKADMRTVITAIETYAADHSDYPTYHYIGATMAPHFIGGSVPGFNVPDPNWNGANPLTTPIAYLSRFCDDPFARIPLTTSEAHQYFYVNWPYAIARVGAPVFESLYAEYGAYRLHSRGPDGDGPDSGIPYDPTNGTISNGDIIYGPKTGFAFKDVSAQVPN